MMKFYFYERDAQTQKRRNIDYLLDVCVRACLSRDIWIYNRAEQSQREPTVRLGVCVCVCVCECVTCSVWEKDFPFECNFVVRTQFKILSKSRYSLILNRTGPTKSDKRQKLRATAVFIVLTPFKCISFDTMFCHPLVEIVQCFCHLVTYCAIV